MKILRYCSYILGLLVVLALILILYARQSSQIITQGHLTLSGLQGSVMVDRDQFGIPHITAVKSDNDAFFALGFVQAQDRFWQMEMQRRITQGTLSEIFGSATLVQDEFLRTWGFYRAAQASWPALDNNTKAIIHSYTAGVNAFLQQGHLPIEFKILHYTPKPWTDIDSLAWAKMLAFDLQGSWSEKITNYSIAQHLGPGQIAVLAPNYPATAPTILSTADLIQSGIVATGHSQGYFSALNPATLNSLEQTQKLATQIRKELNLTDAPGKGSNNWVIAGKLTASGKPLLANDPHLSLQLPGIWYLAELKGPHLHVIGATLPGLPVVVIGHNNHIAWGVTNVNPDTQDLYIEPTNIPLQVRHEIIKVRGNPAVDWPVYSSPEGPIINQVTAIKDQISQPVALKWTALLPGDTTIKSFIGIDYAQNWPQFVAALQYYVVPSQNFVYADTAGNIGYYAPGAIPLRSGWNSSLPVTDTPQHQWTGYIPFAQLPHAYNPPENYIASANNAIVNSSYPYHLTMRWREPPYRIERILTLLKAQPLVDIKQCQTIQTDTVSYLWTSLKPLLLTTHPLDTASTQALALLKTWNGNSDINSVGATIFAFWYRELTHMAQQQAAFLPAWNEPLFIRQQLASDGPYCRSTNTPNCATYLSHTLQQAMQEVQNCVGSDPNQWQWVHLHHAVFKEMGLGAIKPIGWIWNRAMSSPGGLYTVNVGTYDATTFTQIKGGSYRQIIDLSNFNQSLFIAAPGQSGNIFSAHYQDQLPLWVKGQYIPMSTAAKDWGKINQLVLDP